MTTDKGKFQRLRQHARRVCFLKATAWPRLRIACATTLLLVVLTLPVAVQAQYTYTTNNNTITITGYTGPGGAVTIPDTISGLPVTTIGTAAFYYNFSLTSITIPNSVTSIEGSAFYFCINLTSVMIPNSVTNIGDWAFHRCTGLASFTIPNSVASIGGHAFRDCTGLTNVTFGDGVTTIGSGAFWNCTGLTSVTVPKNATTIGYNPFIGCSSLSAIAVDAVNSSYSSEGGVLLNKSQTTLIAYPSGKAGSYTISNSVTSIAERAFQYSHGLTNVTVPNSVTSIGFLAFTGCSGLVAITVNPQNSSYCSVNGVLFNSSQTTLIRCPMGKTGNHMIPKSVTSIENSAFFQCTNLTSITIPNSVTSIGDYAFWGCTSLTEFRIPNSVTSIGDTAFAYCGPALTGVYFWGNAPRLGDSNAFYNDNNATVYYLPGTAGWDWTFGGRPTALWSLPYPLVLDSGPSFGVQTNGFGFIISWTTNLAVVVEACTDQANANWSPLATNTLTSGSSYFSDPQWTNYPARFYRLRSP